MNAPQTLSKCRTRAGADDLRMRVKFNRKDVKKLRKEQWATYAFIRSGAK